MPGKESSRFLKLWLRLLRGPCVLEHMLGILRKTPDLKKHMEPGMVAQAFNPSIPEAGAGGAFEFEVSLVIEW